MITVSAAASVVATFALQTRTLTITKSGPGSVFVPTGGIDCGATCSFAYTLNQQVVLIASPAAGSTFGGWSGGGCSGTVTNCALTMDMNRTVPVTFIQQTTPPPTNTAAARTGSRQITVTWTAPGGTTGATYEVFRGTSPTNGVSIAAGLTATTYVDSVPSNGVQYHYAVRATAAPNAQSSNSNVASAFAWLAPTLVPAGGAGGSGSSRARRSPGARGSSSRAPPRSRTASWARTTCSRAPTRASAGAACSTPSR